MRMTEPSLREKFAKIREEQAAAQHAPELEAANKFLNSLADDFTAKLEGKIARGEVLDPQPGEDRAAYGPVVVFKDLSLTKVTLGEVRKMDGYARLKEICSRPDVDLCLGAPRFGKMHDDSHEAFKELRVYISRPYSHSVQEFLDYRARENKAPLDGKEHRRHSLTNKPFI
jgi:hypothetical protein